MGETRVIDFGSPGELGELYDLNNIDTDKDTYIGEACGRVTVPVSAKLCLSDNVSTDPDLSPLAHIDPNALWKLDLEYNDVDDEDLRHIAHLTGLRDLNLAFNAISDAGVVHLEGLKNLESLDLCYTHVTDEGLRHLREVLPQCEICRATWDDIDRYEGSEGEDGRT